MVDIPCSCADEKLPNYHGEKSSALGPCTKEIYRTYNLPSRFMYPSKFFRSLSILLNNFQ